MATATKAASKTTTATTVKADPAPAAPASSGSDEKTMALLSHILMIVTMWLGPLIIYLVRKNQPGYALDNAREALNFGITLTIAYIAVSIIGTILAFVTFGMSFLLPGLVWVVGLVFGIMACMAVNKGESYRYPLALRLVKA